MRVVASRFYADVFLVEVTATEFVERGWKIMPDGRIEEFWGPADPAWGSKAPIGRDTGEFWIILHEADTRSFRHASEAAAVKEAERLAALPGHEHRKFYVLRPVKVAKVEGRPASVGEHFRTKESHAGVQVLANADTGDYRVQINGVGRNYCCPSDLRDMAAFLQREADRIEKPVVRTLDLVDVGPVF